ncbi:MAG: flagellar FliJ family protein [Candidatus Korobacteraceae bacterium]
MAFQFTLEAIRRYRQSLEDGERLRLESLLARRTTLLHELEQSTTAGLQLQQDLQRSLIASPIPAAEIHFSSARLDAIANRRALLQRQMEELQVAISQQMLRFQQARRQREVLDSLRDSQLREYRMQQQRRDQAQLDELHLLGRARNRRARFA